MRLWSIHPKYLDSKGLVALWRESLLAKHVLEGRTRGYRNHPQLNRFKDAGFPIELINQYLSEVYHEAIRRNYNFNDQKIDWTFRKRTIAVSRGQLRFEGLHLLDKLKARDKLRYATLRNRVEFDCNPVFQLVDGEIEKWEILPNTLNSASI